MNRTGAGWIGIGAICAGLGAVALGPLPVLALDNLHFETPGADGDLRSALRNASLLIAARRDKRDDAQEILAAARADYARILGALYSEGRYSGTISIKIDGREAADIAPLDLPDHVGTVTVTISAGPLYRFARAEIAPLAKGTTLPERFHSGGRAYSDAITEAAVAAVDGWRSEGHAKARVAGQSLIADHARSTVAADIRVEPGPVVRFGQFRFSGQERTRPERIAEIAGFPTGEVFDPDALETVAKRLRRTGVFNSVTLEEAETLGPGNTLDISAVLAEQKKRRLGFGIEASSFEGLELSGYWLHRNLFRGAERLRIDGSIANIGGQSSGMDYSFGVRFDRPATFFPDAGLFAESTVERLDEEDYTSDNFTLTGGFNYIFSDALTAEVGLALRYSRVDDETGISEYYVASAPLSLTWDRRDNAADPTEGFYVNAGLEPFVGLESETGSGARLSVDARAYRALGGDGRFVLAGRAQAGSVFGAAIDEVPRDFLFYSGGGGTVRGQPYQSLGVYALAPDVRTGGRSFIGLSGELRARLNNTLGLALFYDAGYVAEGSLGDGSGEWHSGAGLGLRYFTGIGPIRFDVAAPAGGDTGDGPQIYIGIGQAF